jgi:hypothetical protein
MVVVEAPPGHQDEAAEWVTNLARKLDGRAVPLAGVCHEANATIARPSAGVQ